MWVRVVAIKTKFDLNNVTFDSSEVLPAATA